MVAKENIEMTNEVMDIAKQVALKHKGIVSIGTDGGNMWINFTLDTLGRGQHPISSMEDAVEKLKMLLKK